MNDSDILSLARISASVALRDEERLRGELHAALQRDLPPAILRETILQTYLFAGYASCINAFIVLNSLTPDRTTYFREADASLENWRARGEELCKRIYGAQYERLRANMEGLHPDLSEWMLLEGYGKVLSRPFLSADVRELLIVAMTAVTDARRQFHSHVRGALHAGATADQLRQVFAEIVPLLQRHSIEPLQAILDECLA